MIKGIFKKTKYVTTSIPAQEKVPTPIIPDGMWINVFL